MVTHEEKQKSEGDVGKNILNIVFLLFFWADYAIAAQSKHQFYGPALIQSFGAYTQGQTVPSGQILYRLFLERSCGLNIRDKGEMHSALVGPWDGIKREGCWYRTVDQGYVIIYRDGTIEKQHGYNTLLRVDLLDDGKGIVKQKKFDYREAVKADSGKRIKEFEQTIQTGIR